MPVLASFLAATCRKGLIFPRRNVLGTLPQSYENLPSRSLFSILLPSLRSISAAFLRSVVSSPALSFGTEKAPNRLRECSDIYSRTMNLGRLRYHNVWSRTQTPWNNFPLTSSDIVAMAPTRSSRTAFAQVKHLAPFKATRLLLYSSMPSPSVNGRRKGAVVKAGIAIAPSMSNCS